jgi:hypothetical protein
MPFSRRPPIKRRRVHDQITQYLALQILHGQFPDREPGLSNETDLAGYLSDRLIQTPHGNGPEPVHHQPRESLPARLFLDIQPHEEPLPPWGN